MLINIEVVNAQLDYSLLLRRTYMYAMRAVASTVFHLMMFPHEGKIVTVDQHSYHDPQGLMAPANVIPTITTIELEGMTTHTNIVLAINTMADNTSAYPLLNVVPRFFADPTMTVPFQ